jgi:hypothetical protein
MDILLILLIIVLFAIISESKFKYINTIFENARKSAKRKKWNKIYLAVDVHDTIVYGNYNHNLLPTEFIGKAKEALQYLTNRSDIELILYTCSHPNEIEKYIEFFKSHNIRFDHINENLDVPNNALGCYDKKLYFNILLDDKSGFDAEVHWEHILAYCKKHSFNYSV